MKYSIKSDYFDESKNNGDKKKYLYIFIALILIIIAFFIGLYYSQKNEVLKEFAKDEVVFLGKITGKYNQPQGKLVQDIDFNLFWEVWDTLKIDYVDQEKVNEKQMFYGALQGMVASIGDPYTVFLDPSKTREFEEDMSGSFEGIGAEIGIRDEILTIIAPLEGTPADKAGLLSGDKVYAINNETTMGVSIDEAVRRIRGPKGTEVILTIGRDKMDEVKDYSIKRDVIIIESIKTEMRKDGIFYLRISSFNDDTLNLFKKAVNDIISENPKGIILDLRNNPGGYLDTSVELASEWIEEGVIVNEEFDKEQKNEYLARGKARLKDFETVVLINRGSASASEIMAGALQDYKKAILVGEQTFGKGSVQILEEFSDGSTAKITVAKWMTPEGRDINKEGITPDVIVELTLEDYQENKDPQLEKAVELINSK